jgi:hypothetical protein
MVQEIGAREHQQNKREKFKLEDTPINKSMDIPPD